MGSKSNGSPEEYGYDSFFPLALRALMENKNNISPLKRKVTQAELARYLGITRQAVSAYTLGTSVPDMLKFKAIADFFKVSYGYLLGTTNIIQEEQKNFVELAGLRPQTQNAILNICQSHNHAFAFMLLVETPEFYEIINAIASYLSINWTKTVSSEELISIDAEVQKKTGGALRAVPAKMEKNMLIMNAQKYLSDAMQRIDEETDPTGKTDDKRIWSEDK